MPTGEPRIGAGPDANGRIREELPASKRLRGQKPPSTATASQLATSSYRDIIGQWPRAFPDRRAPLRRQVAYDVSQQSKGTLATPSQADESIAEPSPARSRSKAFRATQMEGRVSTSAHQPHHMASGFEFVHVTIMLNSARQGSNRETFVAQADLLHESPLVLPHAVRSQRLSSHQELRPLRPPTSDHVIGFGGINMLRCCG